MNPTTLGVIGPGLLNQVPTLGSTGLLSNQGEKKYKLLFHKGSFKKKSIYTFIS